MKTTLRAILPVFLAILLGNVCPAWAAQAGPPPWAGKGAGPAQGGDDLAALERFLSMSDAELAALQEAIARVRALSPGERAALLSRITAYRRLPAGEREEIRAGWGWESPRDRDDWRTMMHGRSPEERTAVQEELQSLSPGERAARKLELLRAWRASGEKAPGG